MKEHPSSLFTLAVKTVLHLRGFSSIEKYMRDPGFLPLLPLQSADFPVQYSQLILL
jgi:hypothetical protein